MQSVHIRIQFCVIYTYKCGRRLCPAHAITNRKSRDTAAAAGGGQRWRPTIAVIDRKRYGCGQLVVWLYVYGAVWRCSVSGGLPPVTWSGRWQRGTCLSYRQPLSCSADRSLLIRVDLVIIIVQLIGPFSPLVSGVSCCINRLYREAFGNHSIQKHESGRLSGTCWWAELDTPPRTAIGRRPVAS